MGTTCASFVADFFGHVVCIFYLAPVKCIEAPGDLG